MVVPPDSGWWSFDGCTEFTIYRLNDDKCQLYRRAPVVSFRSGSILPFYGRGAWSIRHFGWTQGVALRLLCDPERVGLQSLCPRNCDGLRRE
jgi:hypothetical protein